MEVMGHSTNHNRIELLLMVIQGTIKYRDTHCSLTQWTMQLVRWNFLRLKTDMSRRVKA